jgi:Coiled-coil domain-containing protein 90-like
MSIDTLKLARKLREAGFNEAQAEAVAAAVQEGTEGANLVTGSDLALTAVELRAEIAALGSELRAEIAALGSELRAEIAALGSELRAEIAALGSDLRGETADLRADIAAARSDLRAEIAALKSELLGRMFQMILGAVLVNAIAMAGLMFAFAKLLGH